MNKIKKLFLIDGMAIIYRAHFAMIKNPLITRDGRHTSAIFGFLNSIFKIINDEHPDYLAVILDSKAKTFRHELFTDYKANRQKMPEELAEQLSPLYEIINKMNIPLISMDGYEADDLIGTIAKKAENKNFETYIVTGDKDMMQLVSEKVFVYSPGNRFKPTTTYTIDKVKDRWGIEPNQFIDYLAMVGDSSDNIPGVDGIGAKSAVKLLEAYSTLETILEIGSEASNKRIREGILKGKDLAYLSKKLVTIDCAVPFEFHLENFILKSMDSKSLSTTFKDLELNSLVNKVANINNETKTDMVQADKGYILIDTLEALKSMIDEIGKASIVSFDLIPKGFDYKSNIIDGITFSISKDSGWYISLYDKEGGINDDYLNMFKRIFENDKYSFCSQNIKQHIVLLLKYNILFKAKYYDVILAEHLLKPERHSYSLDFLSMDYCDYNMKFDIEFLKGKKIATLSDLNESDRIFYCCERSDIIYQSYRPQKEKLISESLYDYYKKIELPLVNVLSDIENEGVYVNQKILNELSDSSGKKIDIIMNQIFAISNYEFNINSPQQLAVLLFDDLKLKEIKKRSTAVEVLKVLRNHHPIADLILEYRHLSKLKNTYLDAFPKYINKKSNKIHTSFVFELNCL